MGKSFVIIVCCCFAFSLSAQDSLCVFNLKGSAYSKIKSSFQPISKGMFITEKSTLLVNESSEITTINSKGEAYQISNAGEYKYSKILEHNTLKNAKGLTSKYLKLIWNELLKKNSGKTIIGGVFRGDILMEFPIDSASVASSKLTFKWKIDEETSQYYFFIKNIETDELIKFATNGSELSLYKDHSIFSEGDDFEWTVSTSEYPNLKNMPYYTFSLIDRAAYEALKANYKVLISDLKTIGLSDSEIENSLCETYGICKM
jgi:hypothetical protein